MKRAVPIHYLRPNEGEWTPKCVMALDTETYPVSDDRDIQSLRCWVLSRVDRPNGVTDASSRVDASGLNVASLVDAVDMMTKGKDTVWLYAHNLAFDMAVTRLPVMLADRGWKVTDFALDGRAPWIRLAKGRKHLTLADSFGWISRPLEAISSAVGIVKPPLPAIADDIQTWIARCKADVDILLAMMSELMDWWQSSGRGRWSITGAASGWNSFRHTDSPFKVVIDLDSDGTAHDRKAIYGGKRYVNYVGSMQPGGYAEVDFAKAYTVIARDMPLPIRRGNKFTSLDIHDPRVDNDRWGIIAEVEIKTDKPRWPVRHNGRVWYPVGRFKTVLASPDIIAARKLGCLVSIGEGYTYQLAPFMKPWAQWCLNVIDGRDEKAPEVARLAARQWGRTVVGKWAQRGYVKITLGYAISEGWGYEQGWMMNEHTRSSFVDIGGRRYLTYLDGDGENSFPAVLAFVESHVRTRLNDAIDAIGQDAFIQCDTDGMIVSTVDLIRRMRKHDTMRESIDRKTDVVKVIMERISSITSPLEMRVKSTYKRVEIIGPQHIVVDGKRRFAGIPSNGEDIGDGKIGVWIWPRLPYQIASGDHRGYVREYRTYRIPQALASGWIDTSGKVWPVEYELTNDGKNQPLAWNDSRYRYGQATLADTQNKSLIASIDRH